MENIYTSYVCVYVCMSFQWTIHVKCKMIQSTFIRKIIIKKRIIIIIKIDKNKTQLIQVITLYALISSLKIKHYYYSRFSHTQLIRRHFEILGWERTAVRKNGGKK